jgi:hypothetical protein
MVAYNFTLDDTSPMIQYTGSWLRKHPEGQSPRLIQPLLSFTVLRAWTDVLVWVDTKLGMYFSKSFTSSTKKGETAQLKFNGTGIWAYGSKRWNHVSDLPSKGWGADEGMTVASSRWIWMARRQRSMGMRRSRGRYRRCFLVGRDWSRGKSMSW